MELSLTLGCTQDQTLTQAQRQEIVQSQTLMIRLELISALRGGTDNYKPEAHCTECHRDLTPLEIMKGFNTDPNDFTTECTGCKNRFQPKLIWRNLAGSAEIPFYCDLQAQAQLPGLQTMGPEIFQKEYPALYHSVIVHNGTLKTAFAQLGIIYDFQEIIDPTVKIRPFLGRLPDTVIAELSGVKLSTVRRLRQKHGIEACTHASMIEEAGEF